jgi:hypothetical protein
LLRRRCFTAEQFVENAAEPIPRGIEKGLQDRLRRSGEGELGAAVDQARGKNLLEEG